MDAFRCSVTFLFTITTWNDKSLADYNVVQNVNPTMVLHAVGRLRAIKVELYKWRMEKINDGYCNRMRVLLKYMLGGCSFYVQSTQVEAGLNLKLLPRKNSCCTVSCTFRSSHAGLVLLLFAQVLRYVFKMFVQQLFVSRVRQKSKRWISQNRFFKVWHWAPSDKFVLRFGG